MIDNSDHAQNQDQEEVASPERRDFFKTAAALGAVGAVAAGVAGKFGAAPNFARVVIETSGLADPAPILQTFSTDRALGGEFHIDVMLTVVDAYLAELVHDHRGTVHPRMAEEAADERRLAAAEEAGDDADWQRGHDRD